MQQRMTDITKQNLMDAAYAVVESCDTGGVLIALHRQGRKAYVSGSLSPIVYPSFYHARRAIRRHRKKMLIYSRGPLSPIWLED